VKPFSLLGLLRLRKLQEDKAAASLAVARRSQRDTAAKIAHTHARLASVDASVATSDELFAIAATRSSSASMLADLVELERRQADEVDVLAAEHADAVRASRSIEKLEERHAREQAAAELAAEQRVLDELALRRDPEADA
jgi:flagellar protein FliJ